MQCRATSAPNGPLQENNRLNQTYAQGMALEAIQTRDERIAQRVNANGMGAFPCHVNHPHSIV